MFTDLILWTIIKKKKKYNIIPLQSEHTFILTLCKSLIRFITFSSLVRSVRESLIVIYTEKHLIMLHWYIYLQIVLNQFLK